MKKNVAVLLNRFQCEIFQQIIEKENLQNIIIIHPKQFSGYDWSFCNDLQVHTFDYASGYLTLGKARTLISKAKAFQDQLSLSENDIFWFANDNDPFVQVIYHYVGFVDACVLEDGLGSYVQPSFLAWRAGAIAILRKIKLIIYLLPYYRSFYRVSADIQSATGYAHNKNIFPGQKNIKVNVVEKNYKRSTLSEPASDDSLVFVGQPLVELRLLSKNNYLHFLIRIKEKFGSNTNFIYRPHPGESEDKLEFLERNNIEINREENISVENYIYSSGQNLIVIGIASTSLIYINNMTNVKKVIAIQLPKVKGLNTYYDALKRLGVKVIKHN